MNTILNILPWALAILAGVLYYFKRKKVEALEIYKLHAEALEIHNNRLQETLEEKELENIRLNKNASNQEKGLEVLNERIQDRDLQIKTFSNRVDSLETENLELQNQLDSANQMVEDYQNNTVLKPATGICFQGIFEKLGEMRFTNSAIILCNGQIKLKAIELLHQDHITAIQKLQKAGLFPENLLEDKSVYQFNPKTLEVTIQMISLNEEGAPTGFGTWDWFLFCRDEFISQLTNYISNLLQEGKRHEIAKQVIAEITAPEESEVTHV